MYRFIAVWFIISVISAIIFAKIIGSRKKNLEDMILSILKESLYEPVAINELAEKTDYCRDEVIDAIINLQLGGKVKACGTKDSYTFKDNKFVD